MEAVLLSFTHREVKHMPCNSLVRYLIFFVHARRPTARKLRACPRCPSRCPTENPSDHLACPRHSRMGCDRPLAEIASCAPLANNLPSSRPCGYTWNRSSCCIWSWRWPCRPCTLLPQSKPFYPIAASRTCNRLLSWDHQSGHHGWETRRHG